VGSGVLKGRWRIGVDKAKFGWGGGGTTEVSGGGYVLWRLVPSPRLVLRSTAVVFKAV
jgi:hypothetical protein